MTTRDAPVTPHPGALKTFGDWAVGCDNVRRCAMTSLGEDFGVDWPKLTMTVSRAPGPRGGFDLAFDALADHSPAPDAVSIDGRRLSLAGGLTGAPAAAIATAMADAKRLAILSGQRILRACLVWRLRRHTAPNLRRPIRPPHLRRTMCGAVGAKPNIP